MCGIVQAIFPEIQAVRLFVAENEKKWYVIHTYSGHEERVKKNLEQRVKFMDTGSEIMQVVIPTEEEIEVRSGGGARRLPGRFCPAMSWCR